MLPRKRTHNIFKRVWCINDMKVLGGFSMEKDVKIQVEHSWCFPIVTTNPGKCKTSGKSSDCCWHDCTEYRNGVGTARYGAYATSQWSAFA